MVVGAAPSAHEDVVLGGMGDGGYGERDTEGRYLLPGRGYCGDWGTEGLRGHDMVLYNGII